uniref:Uncharacterized protein n=1 Tax=Oryza sativa subsp. japonica TaxID=39947 RepID=Q6ZCZ9_ORYSJ|nr:hypothetical protein [Oryza sativa Japonica Group]
MAKLATPSRVGGPPPAGDCSAGRIPTRPATASKAARATPPTSYQLQYFPILAAAQAVVLCFVGAAHRENVSSFLVLIF